MNKNLGVYHNLPHHLTNSHFILEVSRTKGTYDTGLGPRITSGNSPETKNGDKVNRNN